MGKPALKGGIGETEPSFFENRDLGNLEKPIRFSFRNCSINKKYCIRPLEDNEIQRFYFTLSKFEEMTWKQVWQMPHEKGFSSEKKGSQNFNFLNQMCNLFSNFLHFRVDGVSKPFRVFGAQDGDLCRIILLDREGRKNHK